MLFHVISFPPQARENLEVAKARIKEAEKRIDADLDAYIAKAYWTEGRNELRRQVGAARCMRLTCAEVADPLHPWQCGHLGKLVTWLRRPAYPTPWPHSPCPPAPGGHPAL